MAIIVKTDGPTKFLLAMPRAALQCFGHMSLPVGTPTAELA